MSDKIKCRLFKVWRHFMHDSLYRNSIYLMMSTGTTALFGFIFWTVSARLYTPVQIGLATTIISTVTLLSNISQLGFNNALIRYLPKSKSPNKYINSSIAFIFLVSIIISVAFLLFVGDLSPKVAFIRGTLTSDIIFLAFAVLSAINGLTDGVFISSRATQFVLVETLAASVTRLVGTFIFHNFHAFGVIYSNVLGVAVSLLVTYIVFFSRYKYKFEAKIRPKVLLTMGRYSAGSYVGNLLIAATPLILPIIITTRLGAAQSAFFYIAMTIANFLYYIPQATTLSLFAEGVNDESNLAHMMAHSLLLIGRFIVPALIAVLIFSKYALMIFGHDYDVGAENLLKLLAVAAVPVSVNYVLATYFRIKDKVWVVAQAYLAGTIFVVFMATYVVKTLNEIGIVWILGQSLILLILGVYFFLIHRKSLTVYINKNLPLDLFEKGL